MDDGVVESHQSKEFAEDVVKCSHAHVVAWASFSIWAYLILVTVIDTGCLEVLKHGKKLLLVFPLVFPIDDDVIHQAQNTGQVVKYLIHPPLEVFQGTGDAEGHLVKTEKTEWGDESHQMVRFLYGNFAKTCC